HAEPSRKPFAWPAWPLLSKPTSTWKGWLRCDRSGRERLREPGAQLLWWRIHVCQIGRDVGRKRMQDDEILTLLRRQRRSTFITRDRDFFKKQLCSDRFCLAYLDVHPLQVAKYVRRLLRHREFKSWSQRKGCVVRVATRGIS